MPSPVHSSERLAVITGAASGIGEAFARRCACEGFDLLLMDKREHPLHAVASRLEASVKVETRTLNLADRKSTESIAREIGSLPRVDLLVNNAGFRLMDPIEHVSDDQHRALLDVHCLAPTLLTKRALAVMLPVGRGAIINVCSLAGMMPGHYGIEYGATKSYLQHFSQALYPVMKSKGIYVQALCPGHTRTGIHSAEELERIPRFYMVSTDSVVAASWRAWERGQSQCIPSWRHRCMLMAARMRMGRVLAGILLRLEKTN